MAMARDGLLPSFFSDVNKSTQVPVKSTLATGFGAATLAFFMDVDQLAGMVRGERVFIFMTSISFCFSYSFSFPLRGLPLCYFTLNFGKHSSPALHALNWGLVLKHNWQQSGEWEGERTPSSSPGNNSLLFPVPTMFSSQGKGGA